ncbi:MAG: ACT domain-containing protein [Lachnospiraceae bacterium]|nr:ACT domain-containing protein [Lachnospiraceae bacterium]MBR7020815.1 ACT domain-containing protein [Lachnospiraceae bacterium]
MKKAIITVVGRDCVGIIAKVCTYLADSNINILDISQTIVGGYFNMMMVVDVADTAKSFDTVSEELAEVGTTIGCVIRIQLEDIFDMMHRI